MATKDQFFGIKDGPFHQELVHSHDPANSKVKKKGKGKNKQISRYVQFYIIVQDGIVKLDVHITLLEPADNSNESFLFNGKLLIPFFDETEIYGFYNATRKVGWIKLGKRP
jgi:hypothetical protein